MIRLDIDRSAKILFDAGICASLNEAEAKLKELKLVVDIDEAAAKSKQGQAAFLTAVNCAHRCFKGGVFVRGSLDENLRVSWGNNGMLLDAARDLGANVIAGESPRDTIAIAIGNGRCPEKVGVRAFARGFAGGAVPLDTPTTIENGNFTPAGVLAGALCVSEAFVRRTLSRVACERTVGWDLINPRENWVESSDDGSITCGRPDLWLVGLGHLGQAYAWTTSFLAERGDAKASVLLQDYDVYKIENTATSLLGADRLLGMQKTRVCANWLERRGFLTALVERKFDGTTRLNVEPPPLEPSIALIGVDNLPTRRTISRNQGFELVIDVGLGDTAQDFSGFFIYSFPGQLDPKSLFPLQKSGEGRHPSLLQKENYKRLLEQDDCSTLLLADTAVGASFVGAAAASFAVAQVLKHLSGRRIEAVISGDLRRTRGLQCVANDPLYETSPYRVRN